jgi:SpoVK/Ycf46/Vps4 family AAA+-type ATPase
MPGLQYPMARSDLIKRLFLAFSQGDRLGFAEAAREVIADESKKHHVVLARELAEILESRAAWAEVDRLPRFEQMPKDKDRGSELMEIVRPQRYLEELVLCSSQRETLARVCEEFRQWEILEANGLRPATRLLFCGPPGCGKTVTAEAVANLVGLPLLHVRFDAVVSSLLGETASNLRKVFDYASRGAWVVLFDEFDAIGRSRDDATEHGELKRVVNAFLQMLDRFRGRSLVIAATNFEQALDPALWRRFDEVVRFERPCRSQVDQLLRKRCGRRLTQNQDVSLVVHELDGATHAEVERIALDALKRVALDGRATLDEADFKESLHRYKQRRQVMGSRRPDERPTVDGA